MNEYILDANILFSAILSGADFYLSIFTKNRFFLPDCALKEIEEYEEMLLRTTDLSPEKLKIFTLSLFEKLVIVPRFLVSDESILKAYGLCKDVDKDDTLYIALSLEFGLPLVTRDKALYKGLKKAGFDNVIMFDEICGEKPDAD